MAEHPCSQRRETAIEHHGELDRRVENQPDGTDVQLEEILKGTGFSAELSAQVNASFHGPPRQWLEFENLCW
jgi:hypothetical protein